MEQKLLFELLRDAVSPFECVEISKTRLQKAGFEKIEYDAKWKLKSGGKYVVVHHDTTMFAFTVGRDYQAEDMVRIAAAHTDYPCLRLKPNADFMTDQYAQVKDRKSVV